MTQRARMIAGGIALLVALYGATLSLNRPARIHPFFESLPADRPVVIAHRGGADLWPENTLVAFQGATDLGVPVLEMDVHQTADGVPVVIHDETVDRTTNETGRVIDFTLEQLRVLDAAYRFSPHDAPATFPLRGTGITVPTLREVFEAFPDAHMIVEVKEEDTALADEVLRLVSEFDRVDRTLLASFSHEILVHFRSRNPDVGTHASEPEATRFLIASWLFSAGMVSPKYEALLVPPSVGPLPVLTGRFLQAADNRRLFVAGWTINDLSPMRIFARRGIGGLITDRPDLALKVAAELR